MANTVYMASFGRARSLWKSLIQVQLAPRISTCTYLWEVWAYVAHNFLTLHTGYEKVEEDGGNSNDDEGDDGEEEGYLMFPLETGTERLPLEVMHADRVPLLAVELVALYRH